LQGFELFTDPSLEMVIAPRTTQRAEPLGVAKRPQLKEVATPLALSFRPRLANGDGQVLGAIMVKLMAATTKRFEV
jgi:hypothetical protein